MTERNVNKYTAVWEALESNEPQPTLLGKVHQVEFEEFSEQIRAQDPKFVERVVRSLYAGDIYFVKEAFPREYMLNLKNQVHEYWNSRPEAFHQMLEGTPDYHLLIDEELAKKYSFKMVRHSVYFFPWNNDPLKLFPVIMPRWRPFKFLGGFEWEEYEKNTPKDGIVDRIQVAQYMPKEGMLETHSDPYKHQRLFISGYMSKRGFDYEGGGFYVIDPDKRRVFLEDEVEIGDMGIGYATVLHGVAPCDVHKIPDTSKTDGRWFLGLYSCASDEVKNRHTGHPVKIEEKEG